MSGLPVSVTVMETGGIGMTPMGGAHSTRIAGLLVAANGILDATPDHEWWQMRPLEVVAFAFPDWEIVAWHENENYNRPTTREPRALLRHRTVPDQWLLIYANRVELLPGRMSTMGQFFRFKDNLEKNSYAVGTPDEIITRMRRRIHIDASDGIFTWLLDQFPGDRADGERAMIALHR